jgi:hypothetical protein
MKTKKMAKRTVFVFRKNYYTDIKAETTVTSDPTSTIVSSSAIIYRK